MSPARMASVEAAIRVVLEFNQPFNRHDAAGMMQLMSDDCVFENTAPAPDGTVYRGKQAVTRFWEGFFRQSSQAHIEVEEIFGLGYRCIMRWKYTWVDAAGQKGYVRGVDLFQVTNGAIREKLSYVRDKRSSIYDCGLALLGARCICRCWAAVVWEEALLRCSRTIPWLPLGCRCTSVSTGTDVLARRCEAGAALAQLEKWRSVQQAGARCR